MLKFAQNRKGFHSKMAQRQSNTGYDADNATKSADDKIQQSQIKIEILERFILYVNNHDVGEIEPLNFGEYESEEALANGYDYP